MALHEQSTSIVESIESESFGLLILAARHAHADSSSLPQSFQYLTPKIRLEHADMFDVAEPSWLHCVCSPERVKVVCRDAKRWDAERGAGQRRTRIVWEPIPDSAVVSSVASKEGKLCTSDAESLRLRIWMSCWMLS